MNDNTYLLLDEFTYSRVLTRGNESPQHLSDSMTTNERTAFLEIELSNISKRLVPDPHRILQPNWTAGPLDGGPPFGTSKKKLGIRAAETSVGCDGILDSAARRPQSTSHPLTRWLAENTPTWVATLCGPDGRPGFVLSPALGGPSLSQGESSISCPGIILEDGTLSKSSQSLRSDHIVGGAPVKDLVTSDNHHDSLEREISSSGALGSNDLYGEGALQYPQALEIVESLGNHTSDISNFPPISHRGAALSKVTEGELDGTGTSEDILSETSWIQYAISDKIAELKDGDEVPSSPITNATGIGDASSGAKPRSKQTNLKRSQRRSGSGRTSDEDGNQREKKRPLPPPATPSQNYSRQFRFACPYQQFDPDGSPHCCTTSNKNPEGGAESFHRVKDHVFRTHDPSTRCPQCWKSFRTKPKATEHATLYNCVRRDRPGKYWMTLAQVNQVRQQRFVGKGVDNWFRLFNILLPQVPEEGPGNYRNFSPYYGVSPVWQLPQTTHDPTMEIPFYDFNANNYPDQIPVLNSEPCDFTLSLPPWEFGPLPQGEASNASLTNFSPCPIPSLLSPPPNSTPSSDTCPSNQLAPDRKVEFLQNDNDRLRKNVSQLKDEAAARNKQLYDAQERLRPLQCLLDGMLYIPSIQQDAVTSKMLFDILEQVEEVNKILGPGGTATARSTRS